MNLERLLTMISLAVAVGVIVWIVKRYKYLLKFGRSIFSSHEIKSSKDREVTQLMRRVNRFCRELQNSISKEYGFFVLSYPDLKKILCTWKITRNYIAKTDLVGTPQETLNAVAVFDRFVMHFAQISNKPEYVKWTEIFQNWDLNLKYKQEHKQVIFAREMPFPFAPDILLLPLDSQLMLIFINIFKDEITLEDAISILNEAYPLLGNYIEYEASVKGTVITKTEQRFKIVTIPKRLTWALKGLGLPNSTIKEVLPLFLLPDGAEFTQSQLSDQIKSTGRHNESVKRDLKRYLESNSPGEIWQRMRAFFAKKELEEATKKLTTAPGENKNGPRRLVRKPD